MAELILRYFVMLVAIAMGSFLAALAYHTIRDASVPVDRES